MTKKIACIVLAALPASRPTANGRATGHAHLPVSHPLHQSEGVSHAAKARAFASRPMRFPDRRARQVVRLRRQQPRPSHAPGHARSRVPMVLVRRACRILLRVRDPQRRLEIQFARPDWPSTSRFLQAGDARRAKRTSTGTIRPRFSDFQNRPASLLTMPVKNDLPGRVEMTWPVRIAISKPRLLWGERCLLFATSSIS